MNPIKKSGCLCLPVACIIFFQSAQAQNLIATELDPTSISSDSVKAPVDSAAKLVLSHRVLDLNKDLKDQLLPVDSLIELAIKNNPGIKMQDALIQSGEQQIKYSSKEWLHDIVFNFNNSYGNSSLFYNTNQTPVEVQSKNITSGYRAGININIPLYEVFGRGNRIGVYRAELHAKEEKQKDLELEVARRVIYEYNYVISAHRVMLISSNANEAAALHLQMAEKEFQEAAIPVADFSRITEFATKAQIDFEVSKREFFSWYQQLERLIGVRMDTLVRN